MNPDQKTPVLETATFDGGDATEAEQKLMDEGLEDPPVGEAGAGEGAAAAGSEGVVAGTAAGTADAGAAAALSPEAQAEADRVAAEQKAEQDRIDAEARAANERAADEVRVNNEAIARAAATQKPVAPADFEAEFKKLDQLREDDELSETEYAAKVRALSRQESQYTVEVGTWEADQRRIADDAAAAVKRNENAWIAAALQWEADNAEFMADRLNAAEMQDAIAKIAALNAKEGRFMAPAEVLDEAARHAFRRANWTPKTPVVKDPKNEVANAVADRRQPAPGQTLGDLPAAGSEVLRGTPAYEALDKLGIEDLEETTSRMSAAEQEKWLRDAPGANANGRGNDPV